MSKFLIDKPSVPEAVLVLAHGAGAGSDSDFMQDIAAQLCALGIAVVRFDFPYMHTIQKTGKRRPPDKIDKLTAHFLAQIDQIEQDPQLNGLPIFIGGKSMGGRVSTLILNQAARVQGAVVLGYPFHPPGKPEKLRTAHLMTLEKPLLIVQGERDTFGTSAQITEYGLPDSIQLHFLADGDHSLKPRKSSGFTQTQHIQSAAEVIMRFIQETRH